MDTTQLRFFVAVVDCQSFSKAAARCHTSQPNLSEQIRKLEDRLGTTLLDRSGRQIVPTEAGRLLWERAKVILTNIDETKRELRALATPGADRVSIGVMSTVASSFLAHVLNSFVERYPKIHLDIHENTNAQLLPMIELGSLDLGILGLPLRRKGFTSETLFSEEMLVALHPKHPLTQKKTIYKDDLISEKLIISEEGLCHAACPRRLCKRENFSPRILFRSGQLDTIQSLVASGKGISLIPQTAIVDDLPAPITFRRVEDSKLRRHIGIVMRNNRPLKQPASDFLRHVRTAGQTFKLPTASASEAVTILKAAKS